MDITKYTRRALPVLRETPAWNDFFEALTTLGNELIDFSMLSVDGFPVLVDLSEERIPILLQYKVLKQHSSGRYIFTHDFESIELECHGCAIAQTIFDKPVKSTVVSPPFFLDIYEKNAYIRTKQAPNQIDFHAYRAFYRDHIKTTYATPCVSPVQLHTLLKLNNVDASFYTIFNSDKVPEIGTKSVIRKDVVKLIPLGDIMHIDTEIPISHVYDYIQGTNEVVITGIDKGVITLKENVETDTSLVTPVSETSPNHLLITTPGEEKEIILPQSVEGTSLKRTNFWTSVSSANPSDTLLIILKNKEDEPVVSKILEESLPIGIKYKLAYIEISELEEIVELTEQIIK